MTDKRLLIASGNPHKTREIAAKIHDGLGDATLVIVSLADFPDIAEPEEIGTTYAENAAIKAVAGMRATGLVSLGDDVGLEIDYLNGQPGLYSKRFAGESTPFGEKIRLILDKMRDVPDERRTARFRATVAIAAPGREPLLFEAVREGRIAREPRGEQGFGYDPIFFMPDLGCAMAELTMEQKNRTSHRARVLEKAMPSLKELLHS